MYTMYIVHVHICLRSHYYMFEDIYCSKLLMLRSTTYMYAKLELACSSSWMYIVYACLALPYLAYITVHLNHAGWAASVAQLAEHWTSNPVVTGSNPVQGSSVFFFFAVCLRTLPYLLSLLAYFPLRIYMYEIDHVHVFIFLSL